jgi:hypothetical protein
MRVSVTISHAAAILAGAVLALQTQAEPPAPSRIVGVYGVGGVIGEDGTLWQYLPDRKQWLTIDAAFQGEARETHILPLPVPVQDIQFMQSFGFLVTKGGKVWHYDLNANRWDEIGPPPAKR